MGLHPGRRLCCWLGLLGLVTGTEGAHWCALGGGWVVLGQLSMG